MIQIVAAVGLIGMVGVAAYIAVRMHQNAKAVLLDAERRATRFHQNWMKDREKHLALVEHLRSLVLIGEQDNDVL